jgi:hypothetical protein
MSTPRTWSIQITVDTYGRLIPGANRGAVDRLDDIPTQPAATRAQPEVFVEDLDVSEVDVLFEESGDPDFHELEPHRRLAQTD